MNYNRVLHKALWKANDYSEMKAYCIRECRKAEQQDFYTKESLYKGLSKEATQAKKQIEKQFNRDVNQLKHTIENIDTVVPYLWRSPKKFSELTIEEEQELLQIERNKVISKAEEELKRISNKNSESKKAIELFEQAICEIFNKTLKHTSQKPQKYNAKHYVLAFIFDCLVKNENFENLYGKRNEIEAIGEHRVNNAISGNTFYKKFNEFQFANVDLNVGMDLVNYAGDYWKNAVLDLCFEHEKVKKYLQEKRL